ncbi:MAG: SRPBCC family protein [Candidatus Dormibacteria bacterium]
MTLIEIMKLNSPVETVWELLVERGGALELVPGLNLDEDGRGTLRIMLGGHSVTYRGYARQHVEEPGRRVTWTLSGREVRGAGRAHLEVRARLKRAEGSGSDLRLTVLVDGRGRLDEVSEEVRDKAVRSTVQRFGKSLDRRLAPPADGPPLRGPSSGPPDVDEPGSPGLEIVPPAAPTGGPRAHALLYLLGGLLLGSLVAAIWRWRGTRR